MSDLPHEYPVTVTWQEAKKGNMTIPGLPDLQVATPPEFPGGHAGIWSPEHLFTAAVASCLMTTFIAIAENSKLTFKSFACDSKGYLDKAEKGFVMSKVELFPVVEVYEEKDKERALRILEKAEKACLISNSVKSEVHMQPEVLVI
ncbi:MAG: OsmC family protein [Leptospiraceae bacterium]|nr:OsmC family protein [Leptospiraceae bacterium]